MATILSFVNLSRHDAFLSVNGEGDDFLFVAKVAPGQVIRQAASSGQIWSVVAGDSFQITAGDTNRVYLISNTGVAQVTAATAVASESGVALDDTDYQMSIGKG